VKKSWVSVEDSEQELWAKKYLIKKQSDVTRSPEGTVAARSWKPGETATQFLMRLDNMPYKEESEVALLRKVKAAWKQQLINKSKRKRVVGISLKASNQLRVLAKAENKTQSSTLENLILGNYKKLKITEEDARRKIEKLKDKINKLEETNQMQLGANFMLMSKLDSNKVVKELADYKKSLEKIRNMTSSIEKEIDRLSLEGINENEPPQTE
jgi:hypothetical protein